MKKVVFLFLIFLSAQAFSQVEVTHDVSGITGTDSAWVIKPFRARADISVTFEFTDFDDDDATLDVYYADVKEDGTRVYGKVSTSYPVTLNRTTLQNIVNNDTCSVTILEADKWQHQEVWYKLTLNSVTSGNLIVITNK